MTEPKPIGIKSRGLPPLPAPIAEAVVPWPESARHHFHAIRDIVLDAAAQASVGALIETLKWGQPSWLPKARNIGSTLRLGWSDKRPADLALFVNCNTSLGETMRVLYPQQFDHVGNRALYFALTDPTPSSAIHHCAALTLSYHRKKRETQ